MTLSQLLRGRRAYHADFVSRHAGTEWTYGNVYDPATGAPLNWWQDPAPGATGA